MIGSYLTDTVNIITYSYDEWGNISSTSTQSSVAAQIQDVNKLVKTKEGKEVMAHTEIFLDGNIDITYTDRLQLVSRNGVAYDNSTKQFDILSLAKPHGFTNQFWEVIL